ncbi:molybdopterin-containing oxidoreductase family protein [Nocardioides sp. SYSU DS0651]|uniref:molybdopterin-containing oxidoreductase family protein n=1 Tax=Nocardioides sp. SYSU DS0651 TaxID=3415955 RepID=UPI003F4BE9D4
MSDVVHTYCRICLANCGIEVEVDRSTNTVLEIRPDRQNPYTWRDFCRKGKTAHQVVEHPRRITTPMRRVGDRYVEATYEEAITDIASRLNRIIEAHGADAVGSYHGNPMGFSFATTSFWTGLLDAIGTGNRFWVGSIDQNSAHVVAEEMYGTELVALVPDLDDCDCFLLVGMDPAHSRFNWLENNPNGWNRVLARQAGGADVIVVDPRRSDTAARADTHVPVIPGQDWALLLGLVKVILDNGWEKPSSNLPMTGLAEIRQLAATADLADLADRCGVPTEVITDVARRFASARTAMCITHTGVGHNTHGTIGEWLGQVLNLITDRADQPGGRRYERGYVNMDMIMKMFAPGAEHLTRLRRTPPIVGFHSLAELPDEITTPGEGQIRGLFVAFGNPVVSGPDGAALDAALQQLDLLVAIDLVQRESHRHADWLIPGTHWLEREELSPLLGGLQERPYAHYAQRAIEKPEGVMEEWEFFTELALAMGRNLFGKPGVNRFVRASRRLARLTGRPGLAMNPEWIQRLMVRTGGRIKWKDVRNSPHGLLYDEPRFGDLAGALATPDKKVRLAPEAFVGAARAALAQPPSTDSTYPLLMINKRVREAMNSWLNESEGLFQADRENVVELHPDDASSAGVQEGDLVRLVSEVGAVELRARISDAMRPGVVCVPHGWGGRVFDPRTGEAEAALGANRNLLVDNRRLDPFSQVPIFNSTAVRLEQVPVAGTRSQLDVAATR